MCLQVEDDLFSLVWRCFFIVLLGMPATALRLICLKNGSASRWYNWASGGCSLKDYFKYLKRKRRAAEKRDCMRWRSCEIYVCDFEQLYWGRGVNTRKMQKRWGSPKYTCYKHRSDFDTQSGSKSKKRSGQHASEKEPFQFMYTDWWGDFFHEDFAFAYGSSSPSGGSTSRTGTSGRSCDGDNPSKQKAKAEVLQTIGSPLDRLTLGLSPSGSLTVEELKKAFRASALKWHPDRHEDAAKVIMEVLCSIGNAFSYSYYDRAFCI
ncbi:hypothetical protein L7F22_041855 [Adiantum nelumboides]|nr:hypothetical protein [Adiantum nelumboides]